MQIPPWDACAEVGGLYWKYVCVSETEFRAEYYVSVAGDSNVCDNDELLVTEQSFVSGVCTAIEEGMYAMYYFQNDCDTSKITAQAYFSDFFHVKRASTSVRVINGRFFM